MAKIENRVYRLKQAFNLQLPGYTDVMKFPPGHEFHIVRDVLYMGGFPLPAGLQRPLMDWIFANKTLFVEDTRNF
tara:strand:- start:246 stop:470 length:225 start_codon:yes stop_codon:yes gene_type:complete